MAIQPTQLPVPSESPRDLKFNAGKIDEFVSSLEKQYIDRCGGRHYTIEGLRWLAQQAISQFGYITVDSFQTGATISLPNQVLRDTNSGEYYRWDGSLPKVVALGSTPQSSGGIGLSKWLSVGAAVLASAQDGAGDSLVAVKQPLNGAVIRTQHDKNQDFITVEDFGAVGDGLTDDTLAIQAAIDSGVRVVLSASSPKKKEYKISSPLIIKRQVEIDFGRSEIKQTINAPHFKVGYTESQINSPVLSNVTMINTVTTTVQQIDARNVGNMTVRHCYAYGDNKSYGLIKVTNGIVTSILNCRSAYCTGKDIELNGAGTGSLRTVDTTIYDCRLERGVVAISVSDFVEGLYIRRNILYGHSKIPLEIGQSTSGGLYSGKIQENDFDSPVAESFIYVANFKNMQISENWFAGSIASPHIHLDSGCDSTIISSNQSYPSKVFIEDNGVGTILTSNMVIGGTVPVQFASSANKSVISANTFRDSSSACVDVTNHVGQLQVADNFFASSTGDGISGPEKAGMYFEGNKGDKARGETRAAYVGSVTPRSWTVGARPEHLTLIGGAITSVVVNGTQVWPLSGSTYNQGSFVIGTLRPGSTFTVDFNASSAPWLMRIKQ